MKRVNSAQTASVVAPLDFSVGQMARIIDSGWSGEPGSPTDGGLHGQEQAN